MSAPEQLTDLHLIRQRKRRPGGKDIAEISEDFKVEWNGETILVPPGFFTDFSSVPRVVPAFIASRVDGIEASVVHDYLYATNKKPKEYADELFLEMMKLDSSMPGWRRWVMHQAVKRFGGGVYNKDRPLDPPVGQDGIDD